MQRDSEAAMRQRIGPSRARSTRGARWHRRCLPVGVPPAHFRAGGAHPLRPTEGPEGGVDDMHRKVLPTLMPGVLALVLGMVACTTDDAVGPEGPGADALMGGGKPP